MLLWLVQASESNDDVTKILIYWFESQCIVGRRPHQTETVHSGIFKKTKRREKKEGKTVRKIRTEKNKFHGTFHVA